MAEGPVLEEELSAVTGIGRKDVSGVVGLATDADLVQRILTRSGEALLYSPFLAFEQPDAIADVVAEHGSDQFVEEFALVRDYQGLPVDGEKHPVLLDAIARGMVTAPSVRRPDGVEQPFVAIP